MFRCEICFNNWHYRDVSDAQGLGISPATKYMPPPATFEGLRLVVHLCNEHFDAISMVYLISYNIEGKELATCPVPDLLIAYTWQH